MTPMPSSPRSTSSRLQTITLHGNASSLPGRSPSFRYVLLHLFHRSQLLILLAQLADSVGSLVWSTKPELASRLKSLEPDVLAAMVNAAFRLPYSSLSYLHNRLLETPSITSSQLLSEVQWRSRVAGDTMDGPDPSSIPPLVTEIQPGSVASFPLRMSHAEIYLGEPIDGEPSRTALVGDAAHTVHPLAGQGLNMGLGDVSALRTAIAAAADFGIDIGALLAYYTLASTDLASVHKGLIIVPLGSLTALRSYSKERYLVNHGIISAIDKLHKLYALEAPPVVWARSTGLEVLNELTSLKAAIMGHAGASPDLSGRRETEAGTHASWGPASFAAMATGFELVFKAQDLAAAAAARVARRVRNVRAP
jgi:ubiquinone biosynthesis monooxygenase Coq6